MKASFCELGTVTSAYLPSQGHKAIGVDVNVEKVDTINDGRNPVIEPSTQSHYF